MIGLYVHHVGRGHLHRAGALAAALGAPVTGLSSLARPAGWPGRWVELPRDDEPAPGPEGDVDARGRLHWVPRRHPGLRSRMAAISAWLEQARPRALVVDVSVEVTLLGRLHGVPVVGVVLPGDRGDDAHLLGYDVADALLGFWPPGADLAHGLSATARRRLRAVGGLSRFEPVDEPPPGRRHVVVMLGAGGDEVPEPALAAAVRTTPDWLWRVVGGRLGPWQEDPWTLLRRADVVVAHAGQNSVAEIAAARRPAVVVPARRPFDEQEATAAALEAMRLPVRVEPAFPDDGWPERLRAVARLDAADWRRWCDGGAAGRAAAVVREVAR